MRLRRASQELTESNGVRCCGRRAAWRNIPTIRKDADGRAFYAGVLRCASPWECPVCQTAIQRGRAEELRRFGEIHRGRGGELYLATLTIPHHYGDALHQLRRLVALCWRKMQAGKAWVAQVKAHAIRAWIRALEVTVGRNGWHPHLHVLVATAAPLEEQAERALLAWLRARWEAEVGRVGWTLPSRAHGVTLSRCERDDYLTKMVAELVRGGRKEGRGEEGAHRTPWQLLRDVADFERPADVALWREYSNEMRGARQLTWGGELRTIAARAEYGLPEQTDLELADAEERTPSVEIWSFEDPDVWQLVADCPRRAAQLLEVAEAHHDPDDAMDAVWRQCELFAGRELPPF